LENLGIDGGIIFKWMLKKCDGGMGRISLAQDRDGWRAVMSALKTFRFHKISRFIDKLKTG